ncbi:DnaJ domain-containing protein [Arenimonas oryziterrae]|uniref:J domain-containing protein n=1 Tax=Arenimonas oryziterrae DSM 21050 = YC6267 TaxID=1121015 RepID=A0A091B058_9GAMM|nr:DnaJ domain-containing protein [Arenimonas oryziterrae]KFN45091.1 hypothetical protein N789_03450 [Arenimonas oryziterrae DSM 21050 = YC6267]
MTVVHSPALEQALAVLRTPTLLTALRDRPLPDDMLTLLRIAAREESAILDAIEHSRQSRTEIIEAATFLIQQLMFAPNSDSYRVLGVDPDADAARIKEHYRWLVRWLHPDRNSDEWEAVFADRVNLAWQDLRTPDRRRAYDTQLADLEPRIAPPRAPAANELVSRRAMAPTDGAAISSRTIRLLPTFILGGLAILAIGTLGLQYTLQKMDEDEKQAAAQIVETPAEPVPEATPASPLVADVVPAPTASVPEPVPAMTAAPPPEATPPPLPAAIRPDAPPIAAAPAIRPPVKPARRAPAQGTATPVAQASDTAVVPPTPPMTRAQRRRLARAQAQAAAQAAAQAEAATNTSANVAPAATNSVAVVETARRANEPALIDDATAQQLIERFRGAYSSGDLARIQAMLSTDRRSDRRAILRSYRQLFETTEGRRIDIHDASWLVNGDTAVVIASFDAWIQPRGQQQRRRFSGDIRFDLKREDGELRISRLRHDSQGG